MNLPSEIIELIASNLPKHEYQYKCLTVCTSWYGPVLRALYKSIYVQTRHQLKLLLKAILKQPNQGLLVRQVYLSKSINNNIVGITTQELDQLTMLCPYLEVLDFDQKLWKYIQFPSTQQLQQLPTLTRRKTVERLLQNTNNHLKHLSLHGQLVSQLFNGEQPTWISLLKQTPRLTKLCLNSSQTKSHVIPVSLYDMETLHNVLPLLDHLELTGSFRLLIKDTDYLHIQPTRVSTLKLQATIPTSWIYYMAHKYPKLQRLDMEALPQLQDKKPSSTAPSTNNASLFFSMLLRCCPQLRQLELDSATAQFYLTPVFFTLAKTHASLCHIKIKDLPYHVLSRDCLQVLASDNGCDLITGLGVEVIGSDLNITTLLNPLSRLSQLTELALCCGHPYFDCALDLVLDQCPSLTSLVIRSAHLRLASPSKSSQQQHRLKKLALSTVSFDANVFDLLGEKCQALNYLSMYECDQTNEQCNVVRLRMPQNEFLFINLNAIRVVPQENVRIMSLLDNTALERWYHTTATCHPGLQRFNDRRSTIARQYYSGNKHIDSHHDWQKDLVFGHIVIECKSVEKWELICSTTFNEY